MPGCGHGPARPSGLVVLSSQAPPAMSTMQAQPNAAASRAARRASTAGREVLVGQRGVAAAEEHQRAAGVSAGFRVPDAADDDLVIAAGQCVLDGALKNREHIFQPW